MTRQILVTAVLLLFSGNVFAALSGNQLMEYRKKPDDAFSTGIYYGYIGGVADLGDEVLFCIPVGATNGQTRAVVEKYLDRNPELWTKPAAILIENALREAFPCQKRAVGRFEPTNDNPTGSGSG